jgi:hypothetical protein
LFWIFLIISKKSKSTAAVTIFLKTNLLGFRNIGPLVIGFYIIIFLSFFSYESSKTKKESGFSKELLQRCCSL